MRYSSPSSSGVIFIVVCGLFLASGCASSGDGATDAPTQISPREVANQAMVEYDTNKDGFLDAKELDACPAFRSAMKRMDRNSDGKLSSDEVLERIAFVSRYTPLSLAVLVILDGTVLPGATVTLVPEKFMGTACKPFTVTTESGGIGLFKHVDGKQGLVPLGYYRVEVSKKNATGQELIPEKYNTKTTLGQEVAPDVEGRGEFNTIQLVLTSR